MTYSTVEVMWSALRDRFQKTAEGLSDEELGKKLGKSSISDLLFHTAEVEYMFAEWFFQKKKLEDMLEPPQDIAAFVMLLQASNEHVLAAMRELPVEAWNVSVDSPLGTSTPLEAIGRLMYHAGIHSGQIALIQKS